MKAFSRPSSGPPQLMQRTFASTGAKASGAKASTFTSAYFAAQWGHWNGLGRNFSVMERAPNCDGYLRDQLSAPIPSPRSEIYNVQTGRAPASLCTRRHATFRSSHGMGLDFGVVAAAFDAVCLRAIRYGHSGLYARRDEILPGRAAAT